MVHVFYNGSSAMGTVPQYLTSVFGGAYVIFQIPENVPYDPVNDKNLQTRDLSSSSTKVYAKIPIRFVLDGVEAGHNETKVKAKRMPVVLDAGMTYVGCLLYTSNPSLKVASNEKSEIGFDLYYQKASLHATAFKEHLQNGYSMTPTFAPVPFKEYKRANDGAQPVYELVANNPVLAKYYVPANGLKANTKGVEFDLNVKRKMCIRDRPHP